MLIIRVMSSTLLNLMLLVASFGQYKMMQKPEKWLKPWHMGTHLRVLSEIYLLDTNMTCFRWLSKTLCLCALGESCLNIRRDKGLKKMIFGTEIAICHQFALRFFLCSCVKCMNSSVDKLYINKKIGRKFKITFKSIWRRWIILQVKNSYSNKFSKMSFYPKCTSSRVLSFLGSYGHEWVVVMKFHIAVHVSCVMCLCWGLASSWFIGVSARSRKRSVAPGGLETGSQG